MAYIRRLPSGKFQATVRHPSGRKVTKTDPFKRVVQAWASETEAGFRAGTKLSEQGRRLTVGAWSSRWLAARHVEATTAAKDESRMRTHVLPHWETWPLQSIGRMDVAAWVKGMIQAGVGATTVTGSYQLLSAMLSDAVLEGLISTSPCREIDLPQVTKPDPRWLTRHEYDRIQLALADVRRGHVWQAWVGLGCFSGLRPGELAGLDVGYLDFNRQLVRVSQVMTRHGLRSYPKSDTSVRSVPFPQEVGDMLWRLAADRSSGPVFTSAEGARVSEVNFRNRVWRPALAASGVEYVRPYVMRHTCASWLVQAGVPTWEIVKMLGHSSSRLVDVYAHLAPDVHDRVRAAWGEDSRRTSGALAPADAVVDL